MTRRVQIAGEFVLFHTAGSVMHVTQVIFTLDVILMLAYQLVLVRQLKQDGE